MNSNPKIFFSYAWGDDLETGDSREKLVDELYQSLLKDNYNVIRDKHDLRYTSFISDFIKQLGQGECTIVAISNKYVRSEYCMYELYEIALSVGFDKHKFSNKVLPVMVERIDFSNSAVKDELLSYWRNHHQELLASAKKNLEDCLDDESVARLNRVRNIMQSCDKLVNWLGDMNTLTPTLLSEENFAIIKQTITSRLQLLQQPANTPQYSNNATTSNTNTSAPSPASAQATAPVSYKLPNIRKFLENAFNDTELKTLCMDYFPEVENRLSDGMSKSQKINELLDYCKRNLQFPELLQAMEDSGKKQFELYKPYHN